MFKKHFFYDGSLCKYFRVFVTATYLTLVVLFSTLSLAEPQDLAVSSSNAQAVEHIAEYLVGRVDS